MIYNSEIGKIYDSLFFFYEHFNGEQIDRDYIKIYNDTHFMVECYRQISEKVDDIPDFLSPLFYSKSGRTSPISVFFSKHTDFLKENIDSFILKLTTGADLIYQETLEAIFSDYEKSESKKLLPTITPGNYIEAIKMLDAPLEFKLQISLLFGNFNYAVSVLASLIKKAYTSVCELHIKYAHEIEKEFGQIQSEANIKLYSEAIKYNSESAENTIISITLVNQYVVYGPRIIGNKTFMMLGVKNEESLAVDYGAEPISIEQFAIACGNELRLEIINLIVENGEMTSSQIARSLDCPITTIVRHVDVLKDNGVIYISQREGMQIFYRINKFLFKKILVNLEEKFKHIIKDGGSDEK